MARAKLAPKQPVLRPANLQSHLLHTVELVECPLCIEPLDATDRDFWPCPCGYQVCLFCYQRLQSEYNNTCPGCRQQYSDDLDGVRQHIARKQQQQKTDAAQHARGALLGSSHGAGHHPQHHHSAHHGHAGHAASNRAKAAANAVKQRGVHGRAAAHSANEASNSSLPATASWAVASGGAGQGTVISGAAEPSAVQQQQQQQPPQQQQQEPPPPAAGDESAWPTLGAVQQQQPKAENVNAHERRRSSSSSLTAAPPAAGAHRSDVGRSSFESTGSTHTNHSDQQQRLQLGLQTQAEQQEASQLALDAHLQAHQQEQQQQQQQLERNSSGFTTVEVSTVVSGKRHDVCVHVSHAEEVKVYPEAAVLLDMLQQAVHNSKLSSTEAAVQLVQCLRKLEADGSSSNSSNNCSKQANWLQQVLAAKSNGSTPHSAGRPPLASRAPPPGFGPAAGSTARTATANGNHSVPHQQHNQQQQQQHELPPAGWSSAHRNGQQQQQLPGETPQGSMHSVDSTNSLFSQGSSLSQSMWTDNGLPGVDLGVGVTRLAGGLGTTGLTSAVPARLQMLWANGSSTLNGAASTGLPYSSSTVTGPPPGFGGAAGSLGLGSRLNGLYNPLSFANAGAAQQSSSSIGLPPGFGLSHLGVADSGVSGTTKQQQTAQQSSLYQPF